MFEHARQDLAKRIKPGTPHYAEASDAMKVCKDLAEQAAWVRSGIKGDTSLSLAERKRRLDDLAAGSLSDRLDELAAPFAGFKARLMEERGMRKGSGYVPPDEAAALDNISAAEAAIYFARRDLEGR